MRKLNPYMLQLCNGIILEQTKQKQKNEKNEKNKNRHEKQHKNDNRLISGSWFLNGIYLSGFRIFLYSLNWDLYKELYHWHSFRNLLISTNNFHLKLNVPCEPCLYVNCRTSWKQQSSSYCILIFDIPIDINCHGIYFLSW